MAPNKKNGKKSGDRPKKDMGFLDKSYFDEAATEGGRELYRAQIKDLEERLER